MTKRETLSIFQEALVATGYVAGNLRRDYPFFDPTESLDPVRRIPLAAFGGYPQSYNNARVGIVLADDNGETWASRHRALGAPLVITVHDGMAQPWAVGMDYVKPVSDAFPVDRAVKVFEKNRDQWGQQAMGRIQTARGFVASSQPELFDTGLAHALARKFQTRLKEQLETSFQEIASAYRTEHEREPEVAALFAFLFRFVTAKIFKDRGDAAGWADLDTPLEILKAAEKHTGLLDRPESDFRRKRILEVAWASVSRNLHFQNLAVPDLAFVAESAFISDRTRDEFGVHSTPAGLAEFIVEQLPWGEVPVEERIVWEPFCGHGIFLAKALERLGRDLKSELSPRKRHEYFQSRLIGVETDPLSLEICRLVLTLSDYPNGNSWDRLHHADVFEWPEWDETLDEATAILANPPYETFKRAYREQIGATKTKPPAEMLHRMFVRPPKLLGLVLPQAFLSDPVYRDANRQIARRYDSVRIVELPRIFRYADNETVAIIASGLREKGTALTVAYSEVKKDGVEHFLEDWHVSEPRSAEILVPDEKDTTPFSLRLTAADAIFAQLRDAPKLGDVSEIHKGVNWIKRTDGKPKTEPRTDVASNKERNGFELGAEKMRGNLFQFQLRATRYLSLLDKHQDPSTKANHRPWKKPKAVCNAAALDRGSPWRLQGFADAEGLAFTKQFFAIWPDREVSEFAISAILSSPIANAFFEAEDVSRRDNRILTLAKLPLPPLAQLQRDGSLHRRAFELQDMLAVHDFQQPSEAEAVWEAVLRLDAAVLDAYGLGATVQTRLMRQFNGWARPLPPPFDQSFKEYFPAHFEEEITVSELLAITYDWAKTSRKKTALIEKKIERVASEKELATLRRLKFLTEARGEFYAPLADWNGRESANLRRARVTPTAAV
jgi:hypothetical protein